MRAILLGGGLSLLISLIGTRYAIKVLARRGYGQEIRDDGPTTPPHQARHAHHGRARDHPGHRGRLLHGQAHHPADAVGLRDVAAVPLRRAGHGRVPRRLHQDQPAAQPRPAQPRQDDRADRHRRHLRHPGAVARAGRRPRPDAGLPPHLLHPRLRGVRAADRRGDRPHLVLRHRLQQRRQPHRRPRRPGDRVQHPGLRGLHAGQHLAELPVLRHRGRAEVLRGARPARPRRDRRRDHRCLLRLPVVERLAGPDLHGGHRLPRPRRRAWPASPS